MKYLLDTNVCIDVLRGRPDVVKQFKKRSPADVVVSVITAFELVQGAKRAPVAQRAKEEHKVEQFLSVMTSAPFDLACATLAGDLNAKLLNNGTPVGVMDVFIAATAMVMDLPVVTSNLRDFSKVKGLKVLNWRD